MNSCGSPERPAGQEGATLCGDGGAGRSDTGGGGWGGADGGRGRALRPSRRAYHDT